MKNEFVKNLKQQKQKTKQKNKTKKQKTKKNNKKTINIGVLLIKLANFRETLLCLFITCNFGDYLLVSALITCNFGEYLLIVGFICMYLWCKFAMQL